MSAIYDFASSMWRQMKDAYDETVDAAYRTAEDSLGCLLSNEAQHLGISAESLFTGSEARAYRLASSELVDYWETTPRPRLADFERQWIAGYLP